MADNGWRDEDRRRWDQGTNRFEGDPRRQRVIGGRAIRLDTVGHRIHTGRGRQLGRQAEGQLRIEDRHSGHDRRTAAEAA